MQPEKVVSTPIHKVMAFQKPVVSIRSDASLTEAARLMQGNHIGNLLVVDEEDHRLGVVTDRDIVLEGITLNKPTGDLKVSDVMTPSVICAKEDEDLFEMITLMADNGITRLPIVDQNENVIGIVTARKILQVLVQALHEVTHISEQQQANEIQPQTRH